jgi:hypothetical protein
MVPFQRLHFLPFTMMMRLRKFSTVVLFSGTTHAFSAPVALPKVMQPVVGRHMSSSLQSDEDKVHI